MMLKMSVHAQHDRFERLTYLATEIGLGEITLTLYSDDRRVCITNTGLIIVLDKEGKLITAYLPDINRVNAMYWEKYGRDSRLPYWLYVIVLTNQKKHGKYLEKINLKYHKQVLTNCSLYAII